MDCPSGGVLPVGPSAEPGIRKPTRRLTAPNSAGGPGIEKIRLLIADDDRNESASLYLALSQRLPIELIATARDGAECLNLIRRHKPDVVLLKDMLQVVDSLRVAETVADELPEVKVILMTTGWIRIEARWHELLHAGIAGFVNYPPQLDNLLEQIDHIVLHQQTLRHHLASEPAAADAGLQSNSRVIAFAAPRGGCCRSVLASNLAVSLASRQRSVCVVDLNIDGGDIAALMDMRPTFTLGDLALSAEEIESNMIENILAQHSSGVRVMPAPSPGMLHPDALSPYFIQRLLGHTRTQHDFTIVDPVAGFSRHIEAIVGVADAVIAVVGFDLVRLQQGAAFITQIAEAGIDRDRIFTVLVSESEHTLIALDDAQRVLNCPICCILPFDPATTVESINSGVPFVTSTPNRPISRAVRALARKVAGDFTPDVPIPWWKRMLHLAGNGDRPQAA